MSDLLIFTLVGILLPTVALSTVASLCLLVAAVLRPAPVRALSIVPALFAALRLQVAFVSVASVVLGLLFGRVLAYGLAMIYLSGQAG